MWKDIFFRPVNVGDVVAIAFSKNNPLQVLIKDYIVDYSVKKPVVCAYKADGTLERNDFVYEGKMILIRTKQ